MPISAWTSKGIPSSKYERFIDISFEPLLGLIDPVDLVGIAWVIVDDVYERKAIFFSL